MKSTLVAVALATLALTLSGCGANEDEQAAKALSANILEEQKKSDSADQFLKMDKKDADCIGNGLVEDIGTDQLKEYELLTKDLKANNSVTDVKMSTKDAESATDVLFKCTDVEGMMQKALDNSGQIPAEMRDCVNKALSDDVLRDMFSKMFAGKQDEAQQALIGPVTKCATANAG